ncbi:MAG: hypothetical protein CME06_08965 [Gemmatimonadetes bacterium]|nr:hypothetical protein [Gemmatimonadota bacterium]
MLSCGSAWARRLIPERWRLKLHPFPSLREPALQSAGVWEEIPEGPVLVWSSDPAGTLIGCGGTLARWADAGISIDLVRIERHPGNEGPDPGGLENAMERLGLDSLRPLVPEHAIEDLLRIQPEILLIPGPLDAAAELPILYARAAPSIAPKWIALYEGNDCELANVVVELSAEEVERKRVALAEVSAELAHAADGLAEYRAFATRFVWGRSEAYLRLSPGELRRVIATSGDLRG